jgi:hypothetical protein
MASFFEKPSRQKMGLLSLLLAINSIATQTNTTIILPKKRPLQVMNYTAQREPVEALAASNMTSASLSQQPMNQYLPKALANWTSSETHFMAIGGNIKALNPNLDNVLSVIPGGVNRTFTPNVQFPIRGIITSIIAILNNRKTSLAPILYNNTVIMCEIPNYLTNKFRIFQERNGMVMSDQLKTNSEIEMINEEGVADAQYILTKGRATVESMNATLINFNFYTEKLPLIMLVSQTYAQKMNTTVASLNAARNALQTRFEGLKKTLSDSKDRIFNSTTSLLREVDGHLNQTEGFIRNFTNVIRARNPAVSSSFETAYTAQCNPSNDLLDAALLTVKQAQLALKARTDFLKADAIGFIEASISELEAKGEQSIGVIKNSIDCIKNVDTLHGNNIRGIKTSFFETGANKIRSVLQDGYSALNVLVTTADAQTVAFGGGLSTMATTANFPSSVKLLKKASDNLFFLLTEMSSVFFGRGATVSKSFPLSQNNMNKERGSQHAIYNRFMASFPAPCVRQVIPTLADELPNDILETLDNCVDAITIPSSAPFNPMYTETTLAEVRNQAGIFLPMCFSATASTTYELQTAVPYMYSIYSTKEMVSQMVLSRPPLVLSRVSFSGPIPPVEFEVNAKTFTGALPPMTFYDDSNGNSNMVMSISVDASQSVVNFNFMFSDLSQSQTLLRQSRKPFMQMTVIPDEKPFA